MVEQSTTSLTKVTIWASTGSAWYTYQIQMYTHTHTDASARKCADEVLTRSDHSGHSTGHPPRWGRQGRSGLYTAAGHPGTAAVQPGHPGHSVQWPDRHPGHSQNRRQEDLEESLAPQTCNSLIPNTSCNLVHNGRSGNPRFQKYNFIPAAAA